MFCTYFIAFCCDHNPFIHSKGTSYHGKPKDEKMTITNKKEYFVSGNGV